ncbi:MAG TPA: lantibiotic dehydratase, partial [Longimicrobium sp.]|nr:lantibiotic dehydratase [Longimicrobium sp.]
VSWITHRLRDRDGYGHGKKKAENTLLRYVSRAAAKLSPFSTLTPLALASVRADVAPGVPRLAGSAWRARSLVRIKPYMLKQYGEMLRRYPPLRDTLPVALNNSVTEFAPGQFRFLCPARWRYDERVGKVVYREQSLVKVGLKGPLVARLREVLSAGGVRYRELVSRMEGEFAERGTAHQVAGQIGQLAELGFLHLVLPWSGHEMHLEKRMLRHLRSLPHDDALAAFTEPLERLVRLEDGYAAADDPGASLREIERLPEALWRAAAPLGGLDPEVVCGRASEHNVHEEVFLLPRDRDAASPFLVSLSRAAAEEALASVAPMVRLASLFDRRHDFHHAMAALAAERWPGQAEVGLLELFQEVQPLWREYLRFHVGARDDDGWRTTWNPRALPEVEALGRHRDAVLREMEDCLCVEDGVQRLSPAALGAVLDRVPARYTSAAGGACLFLQPASTDGSLWMLNRMKEGTGRFGSRYTPVMDRATRRRYAAHLAARGYVQVDGERMTLLDLRCTQGDNINVHAPQTPAVLTLPGEDARVGGARQVSLAELRVSFPGDGRRAVLRGRDGTPYLAAFLGLAYEDYTPPLIRFLCAFGPSEMNPVFPTFALHHDGPVEVRRRTVAGNVVLQRATWTFPAHLLRDEIAGMADADAFAALNRWRMERGIPDRVFLSERTAHPVRGLRTQPQYLDFTSPLFVALLQSVLEAQGDWVSLVEMLPTPEMFAPDEAGSRWALEVLLDSLAVGPEPLSAPGPEFGARPRAGAASPPIAAGSPLTRA